jgi:hypothetical protein
MMKQDATGVRNAVRQVGCTSAIQALRAAHAVNEARVLTLGAVTPSINETLRILELAFYKQASLLRSTKKGSRR